jgi:hypothetical protein
MKRIIAQGKSYTGYRGLVSAHFPSVYYRTIIGDTIEKESRETSKLSIMYLILVTNICSIARIPIIVYNYLLLQSNP